MTVFMHDNTLDHKPRVATHLLDNEGIDCLPWPAVSPDMNPIEHAWAHMKYQLTKREKCRNSDLFETLTEMWNELTPNFIFSLTTSMRKRILAVFIEADGGFLLIHFLFLSGTTY